MLSAKTFEIKGEKIATLNHRFCSGEKKWCMKSETNWQETTFSCLEHFTK